jgi:6-pyruvoyl-tetrahydropterin synthase
MILVTARTTVWAYHSWPGAPDHRSYLRAPHPHNFGVRVTVRTEGDDRVVEFHDLVDDVQRQLGFMAPTQSFGMQSCEMIAQALAGRLADQSYIVDRVDVTEDEQHTGTWRL